MKYLFFLLFALILVAVLRYIFIAGTMLGDNQRTGWDITLECQKIAAIAFNPAWNYRVCQKELYLQLPRRMLTIQYGQL